MKQQKFLILLIIGLFVHIGNIKAQLRFTSTDKLDMNILGDSLIANAKREYVYKFERQVNKYSYYLEYVNLNDDFDRLYIYINVFWRGENKDLEIEGTPEYNFSYVKAPFLDLFPFWNKFIKKEENIEELTKKHTTYIFKDDKRFLFSKSRDKWTISMSDKIE